MNRRHLIVARGLVVQDLDDLLAVRLGSSTRRQSTQRAWSYRANYRRDVSSLPLERVTESSTAWSQQRAAAAAVLLRVIQGVLIFLGLFKLVVLYFERLALLAAQAGSDLTRRCPISLLA